MTPITFVVPADLDRPTGGKRYDQALAAALGALGVPVELRLVGGGWPVGSDRDRAGLTRSLTGPGPVLVDGLVACGAPEEVDLAVARGVPVHVLVHMPLGLDPGLSAHEASARDVLEGKALQAASGVVATSGWTAADLRDRHGLAAVTVACPGSAPAPLARGSAPPLLLQLAAVTPLKNQLTVVDALARLDGPWQARLAGPLDVDPGYVTAVRERIARHGLESRVALTGPVTGAGLDELWSATDVLLLPSRAETWGLTVTEALARGIPAVVGRGTGAQEALGRAPGGDVPGALVDPASPDDLAAAIRDLLGPGGERAAAAARARRPLLPSWSTTAATVRDAVLPAERMVRW